MASGDREGGIGEKAEAQGGALLPKLLMVHLTVLGRAVTFRTLLSLVEVFSEACPLLERLHLMPCWVPSLLLLSEYTETGRGWLGKSCECSTYYGGRAVESKFFEGLHWYRLIIL